MRSITAKAEIQQREWVEFKMIVDEKDAVSNVVWHAWGCHRLLEAAAQLAREIQGKKLSDISWNGRGSQHWDLMMHELVLRAKGLFKLPYEDQELCHCRKIPTQKVDEAIVLGAHTPEKVSSWTAASTGCGTCRPDVERLIQYRLKKV